jgi:hypothetical protein
MKGMPMKPVFKRLIPIIIGLSNTVATATSEQFHSDIFTYDDPGRAKGLHVFLKGDNWSAQEIKYEDTDFHINLFGDPEVMKGFADGQVRTAESVRGRVFR